MPDVTKTASAVREVAAWRTFPQGGNDNLSTTSEARYDAAPI